MTIDILFMYEAACLGGPAFKLLWRGYLHKVLLTTTFHSFDYILRVFLETLVLEIILTGYCELELNNELMNSDPPTKTI